MKITTPTALVLTAAALVVASSTAGYAGARFTGSDIKDGSIASIDIKNGSISSGDLTPGTVRSLSVGKAYATVTRVETDTSIVVKLDPKRTSGFSKLKHATDGEGIWCLVPSAGVDLSRSTIVVSADYSQSAGIPTVLWASTNDACSGKEIEIHTLTPQGDDEPSPSDQVAFQVFAS